MGIGHRVKSVTHTFYTYTSSIVLILLLKFWHRWLSNTLMRPLHHTHPCLVDVEAWLKASRLRLNPAKTQVMWLGSQQLLSRLDMVDVSILSSDIRVQEKARDLGVVIDSRLSLSDHVASVCRSGYYQLRQLRPVVRCSSEDATKTLVQAFIASRLDYCNVLYYGIYDELIRRLQSV